MKARGLVKATVNPSAEDEGLAPALKKRGGLEKGEPAQTQEVVALAEEETPETRQERVASCEDEFVSGHDIVWAVGSRLTGLLSAGCLLAWMAYRAGGSTKSGAWAWISKVVFDKSLSAASCEGPRKAASFPMRLGGLRGLVERLRIMSLGEVTSPEFQEEAGEDCWLLCALTAVNFLAGHGGPLESGKWSAIERRGAGSEETAQDSARTS